MTSIRNTKSAKGIKGVARFAAIIGIALSASLTLGAGSARTASLEPAGSVSKAHTVAVVVSSPNTMTVGGLPVGFQPSAYGNSGPNGVGDCMEAALATYEQIAQHSARPLGSTGWIAEYDAAVTSVGASPGPTTGSPMNKVFSDWETTGIAGTKIHGVTQIGSDQATLTQQLSGAPVLTVVTLPAPSSVTLPWAVNRQGFLTTPFTSTAVTPPYLAGGAHAVLVVGANAEFVFLATWGVILPVSWSMFESMATASWSIQA
jgi:hypothetical protein